MIAGLILMIAGLLADFLASGLAWFQLMLDSFIAFQFGFNYGIESNLNSMIEIRIKKPEAKAKARNHY